MNEGFESLVTKTIIKHAAEDWQRIANTDVVIVGAGPAGMTAAKYLAESGLRVVVFERRLSFGGGIGGGGMLFHKIVLQKSAEDILKDFGVRYREDESGLLVVDAAELMAKLAAKAIDSGAKIVHGVTVEDVVFRPNPFRIVGVCIQWSAVTLAGLHVDPLMVNCRAVIDATGHEAEVLRIVAKKFPELNLGVRVERSAHAEEAEKLVVEYTGRVLPGLYVAGMSVAALYSLPRMGPVFSSMLLSGKKVAEIVKRDLSS